jgi:hypothetical protein
MIIHCFDFNSVELFEFIFNSELVRIEEDSLQKSDINGLSEIWSLAFLLHAVRKI